VLDEWRLWAELVLGPPDIVPFIVEGGGAVSAPARGGPAVIAFTISRNCCFNVSVKAGWGAALSLIARKVPRIQSFHLVCI
jgi:hypothetical protein